MKSLSAIVLLLLLAFVLIECETKTIKRAGRSNRRADHDVVTQHLFSEEQASSSIQNGGRRCPEDDSVISTDLRDKPRSTLLRRRHLLPRKRTLISISSVKGDDSWTHIPAVITAHNMCPVVIVPATSELFSSDASDAATNTPPEIAIPKDAHTEIVSAVVVPVVIEPEVARTHDSSSPSIETSAKQQQRHQQQQQRLPLPKNDQTIIFESVSFPGTLRVKRILDTIDIGAILKQNKKSVTATNKGGDSDTENDSDATISESVRAMINRDIHENAVEEFVEWMREHSVTYFTKNELVLRFRAWVCNLEIVIRHNLNEASRHPVQRSNRLILKMTKHADLSNEEYRVLFRRNFGGYHHKASLNDKSSFLPHSSAAISFSDAVRRHAHNRKNKIDPAPSSVDWRTHVPPIITPIRDQGQCGSCWAFSTISSVEGAINLNRSTSPTYKIVELSEQELVDCVQFGTEDCDHGGLMTDGFEWAIRDGGGFETEQAYPYTATSHNKCRFEKKDSVGTISSYVNITQGNETELMLAVAQFGVVSVAIDASSVKFQLYSHGIYVDHKCKNTPDDLDHGISVVGYGSENGKDYWICRNSWGTSFGISGYILMSRNANNQCGIATSASFPIV